MKTEKNTIILNEPEKGSKARMWKVNEKLMSILSLLPRESQKVFGDSSIKSRARKGQLDFPEKTQVKEATLKNAEAVGEITEKWPR
jgi:hypothetical protein